MLSKWLCSQYPSIENKLTVSKFYFRRHQCLRILYLLQCLCHDRCRDSNPKITDYAIHLSTNYTLNSIQQCTSPLVTLLLLHYHEITNESVYEYTIGQNKRLFHHAHFKVFLELAELFLASLYSMVVCSIFKSTDNQKYFPILLNYLLDSHCLIIC